MKAATNRVVISVTNPDDERLVNASFCGPYIYIYISLLFLSLNKGDVMLYTIRL